MNKWKVSYIYIALLLATPLAFSHGQTATTTDLLESKIEERNNQIKQLEEEIIKYNNEANTAASEAKTLQSTIKTLDLTKKKITTDIKLTETKIIKTNLTIDELNREISDTNAHIDINRQAIIGALRRAQYLEDVNLVQLVLSDKSIDEVWSDIDDIRQVRETVRDKSRELAVLKQDLQSKQDIQLGQKKNLVNLKEDLTGKKQAVEYTTKEKATVLTQTKNKEQTYKQLAKTKEEQKAQFERELFEYESQLRYLIDPNSYPKSKGGILSWPLDNVYITQRFGKTVGAEKLYTSGSHNGVDFRATIGTPVKNMLTGTVLGTGNTDAYPGCYSFGKWVFVKHDNGLSSIYGHLSVISASVGQRVNTGDVLGYSGNTGYSTGPHLHVSVYASQGVRIEKYVNSRGCKEATLPLADIRAYLDPLAYLPSI
jgi:murein DD-endopeptidase MepM/ murein hydrolase activator NlpD